MALLDTLGSEAAVLQAAILVADNLLETAASTSAQMSTAIGTLTAATAAAQAVITALALDADLIAQRLALYNALQDAEIAHSTALAAISAKGGTHWPVT